MSDAEKLITIANNTPAVCEKVNAEKATISGSSVFAENVLDVPHALDIQLASDTLEDFSGVSVTATGKNMLDCDTLDAEADKNKVLFQGEVTGDFYFSCLFNYESCKTPTAAQFSFVVDGATKYMTRGTSLYNGVALSGTLTKITFINWGYGVGTISEIQLEKGTARTDYVAYTEPQQAVAAADGTVEGLQSISPILDITTDREDVVIACSYLPVAAQTTVEKYLSIKQKMQNLSDQIKEV